VVVEDGALYAEHLNSRRGLAVAEEFRGVAVDGVAEPVVLPEYTRAEPGGEGVVAAADVDGGDLAVVADVDDLAVHRIDGALERESAAGGAHRGLVEDHDHAARQGAAAVVEHDEEAADGRGVADAGRHRQLVRCGC
jgi:hypothetical protein